MRSALHIQLGLLTLGFAQYARAQDAGAKQASDPNEIVVLAKKDQSTQIDRTVYTVRDNAQTQTSSILDVLTRIPTVTVSPNGRVQLLGSGGVKVLIDGKEVNDVTTVLRTLRGAMAETVEVMSNPSAQFSAAGTGGIINIILRKPSGESLKVSLLGSAGSFGAYELQASPTWSSGRWSAIGTVGRSRSTSRSAFYREREAIASPAFADFTEFNSMRSTNDTLSGNLVLGFKPTERQSLSLTMFAFHSDGASSRTSHIITQGVQIDQTARGTSNADSTNLSLDYKFTLNERGESIALSGGSSFTRVLRADSYLSSNGDELSTISPFRDHTLKFDASYVNPFSKARRLSTGISVTKDQINSDEDQFGTTPLGGAISSTSNAVAGQTIDLAAFVTYQFPLAKWRVMPGLRVEQRQYRFDNGLGNDRVDLDLFPSIHMQHDLTSRLKLALSYSRRIGRPDLSQLSSARRFFDSTTAIGGNPNLRPELTDAVEAKIDYRSAKQAIVLTLFQRTTHNPWVNVTTVTPEGIYLSTVTNLGLRIRTGANLSVQGPVGRHLRYTASGNLLAREYRGNALAASERRRFEYSTSLQIEYRELGEERAGFDSLTAALRYNGPVDYLYSRSGGFSSTEFTWSHGLSSRLFAVARISDPFGNPDHRQSSWSSDAITRQVDRSVGLSGKFSLSYRLGPN